MKNRLAEVVKKLKLGNFPNDKNRIFTLCQYALINVQMAYMAAQDAEMMDEQFVIDFLDKLNEISVWDPNVPLVNESE